MRSQSQKTEGRRFDRAEALFKESRGMLRTAAALRAGIHPSTLYGMRDSGVLELVSRGVYRLVDSPPLGNPDFLERLETQLGRFLRKRKPCPKGPRKHN